MRTLSPLLFTLLLLSGCSDDNPDYELQPNGDITNKKPDEPVKDHSGMPWKFVTPAPTPPAAIPLATPAPAPFVLGK